MNYFWLELIRVEYKQREKNKWRRNNIPLMTGFRMKLLATGLWKIRTTTRKQNVQFVIKLLGSLLVVAQPIFFQSKISISKKSGPVSTKNNHLIVLLLRTLLYHQIKEHWIHLLLILILQKQKEYDFKVCKMMNWLRY